MPQALGFAWSPAVRDAWAAVSDVQFTDTLHGLVMDMLQALQPQRRHVLHWADHAAVALAVTADEVVAMDTAGLLQQQAGLFFSCLDFAAFLLVRRPERWVGTAAHLSFLWTPPVTVRIDASGVSDDPCSPATVPTATKAACHGGFYAVHGVVVSLSSDLSVITRAAGACRHCGCISRVPVDALRPPPCRCAGPPQALHVAPARRRLALVRPHSADAPTGVACVLELPEDVADGVYLGAAVTAVGVVGRLPGYAQGFHRGGAVFVATKGCAVHEALLRPVGVGRVAELKAFAAARKDRLLGILVNSLAPEVAGYELVKLALVLSLFGGSARANNGVLYHAPLHMLLVGDRAVGKSSLLDAARCAAPRSVAYKGREFNASRKSNVSPPQLAPRASADGRVAAGGVVEASGGCLVVDDISTLPHTVQATLAEAASAGVLRVHGDHVLGSAVPAVVPCAATLLYTATPASGVFRPHKPLAGQFPRLTHPFLRSVGLVVPVTDVTACEDPAAEAEIACFIIEACAVKGRTALLRKAKTDGGSLPTHSQRSQSQAASTVHRESLAQRLRVEDASTFEVVPTELFHQYITAARDVHPEFTAEGAAAVAAFCQRLRGQGTPGDDCGCNALAGRVGAGLAATLVRLCHARARVDLAPLVARHHIADAMELLLELRNVFAAPPGGAADASGSCRRGGKTSAGATKKEAFALMKALQRATRRDGRDMFTLADVKAAGGAAQIDPDSVVFALDKLHQEGVVIKTASGKYRLLGGD